MKPLTFMLLAVSLTACSLSKSDMEITAYEMQFPAERESGIEQGISACYAGTVQGQLIMAGGCNFPDTPAAEGGKKRFYKGIYRIQTPLAHCEKIGELPVASAYGVSLSTPQGIVCAGGIGEQGALSSVYRITIGTSTHWHIDTLPPLPYPIDNMAGTVIGSRLYLVGGNVDGIPSNALHCLDLNRLEKGWTRLPDFPGNPRTQPVCTAQRKGSDTQLYMWGGFASASAGRSASLSTDGYCYNPKTQGWAKVSTPHYEEAPISLGGGIATPYGDHHILCMGGVNKDIFLAALQREERMKQAMAEGNQPLIDSLRQAATEYMTMPPEAYRFNDRLLLYDTQTDTWTELTRSPETARAGATLINTDTALYQIGGELKPGIRVPRIVKLSRTE